MHKVLWIDGSRVISCGRVSQYPSTNQSPKSGESCVKPITTCEGRCEITRVPKAEDGEAQAKVKRSPIILETRHDVIALKGKYRKSTHRTNSYGQ